MKLRDSAASAMVAHAEQTAPHECCGLLLGTADELIEAIAAANVAHEPLSRYLVDPHDHLRAIRVARARGLQVLGAYHSHPRSAAVPSARDSMQGFSDFLWVIVGLASKIPEIRAWEWSDGNFAPVTLVRVREEG